MKREHEELRSRKDRAAPDRRAAPIHSILGLQRAAGNRSVSRAIGELGATAPTRMRPTIGHGQAGTGVAPKIQRSPEIVQHDLDQTTTAPTTPELTEATPSTEPPYADPMARSDFDQVMTNRFGVTEVVNGTFENQARSIPSRRDAPNARLSQDGWQAWNPGGTSGVYTQIANGFDQMRNALGIPTVSRIVFYDVDYDIDVAQDTVVPQPDSGATYGGHELRVFRRFTAVSSPLPTERSDSGDAAFDSPTDSMARTAVHELAHGVWEIAGQLDPGVFRAYEQQVGWVDGQLYDIGDSDAASAIAGGTTPPDFTRIDRSNWNRRFVNEQPMSQYGLANSMEDFAETLKAFVLTPAVLEARSPRRYAFIQARISQWRTQLQQPPPGAPPVGDFPMPPADGTAIA